MSDFISKDINKFENQMINYIEAYYSLSLSLLKIIFSLVPCFITQFSLHKS